MKTGIVILNYNTPDLTIDLVKLCYTMKLIDKIVVVDNCSPDNSFDILEKEISQIAILVKSKFNCGYAQGNNIGLKLLVKQGCDICIVANPDTRFSQKLVEDLVSAFSQYSDYGVLTTARYMENADKVRQYWGIPSKTELILENFSLYIYFKKNYKEIYNVNGEELIEIGVAPGAFFAIRSKALESINYLDNNTFLYFEENCLSMRIRGKGYKIGLLPNIKYCCLDRNKNSTSKLQQTTKSRQYYCASKEYFAKTYLNFNNAQMLLLKATDKIYIFEKWLFILIRRLFRRK